MIVTVGFLGALAGGAGIDLAELGIDGTQFQTYLGYAEAVVQGLPSPLLPQSKFTALLVLYSLHILTITQMVYASRASSTPFLACGSSAPRSWTLVVHSSLRRLPFSLPRLFSSLRSRL
jgi:hypothetical protein